MRISYDGIVFDLVLLENWAREAVYDATGTDFLYWHHVLDVVVTVGGDSNDPARFPVVRADMGKGKPSIDPFPLVSPNSVNRFANNGLARDKGDLKATIEAQPLQEALPNREMFRNRESQTPSTLPWTDNELRRRLQVPRRQLLVWMYTKQGAVAGFAGLLNQAAGNVGQAEFLLVSPLTGVGTDARHGPLCTVMDLPMIHGNASGIYRLRFETWEAPMDDYRIGKGNGEEALDPARRAEVSLADVRNAALAKDRMSVLPPILSNRWTMRHEPDPQTYLNTLVIEGKVYFRMDVLKSRIITPDQLRRFFMHPLARGYVRMPPMTGIMEGGDAVWYKITDKEVMTNFHVAKRLGLISIDLKQSHVYHSGSLGMTVGATQM